MLSPAQRHMMRVSAEKASSQRVSDPLRSALPYGQMLMKLRGDRQILKSIYSVEDKARRKRDMLPAYAPWIAGVLASDAGNQDDVLMTMLQWSLDAGDIRGTFDMARYALKHGLNVPNNKRPTPYLFAEDVALAAMRARSAGQAVSVDDLLTVIDMTLPHDMPDPVRAKLHKITGLVLRDNGLPEQALIQLKRAMQLDSVAGVKKDIEQLERALRPVAVTAKPDTAPRKTKPRAAPAKRGRPRKAKPASC
ncbi:phage terminase small subunit [Rahnella ecdela]|uniref:Terminase n=1 Tax=Rahnella ecdela TaxID=2816250 RepID=A0ABS6LJN8_9GAMM|nr:phage terminase small subunit [Rahnella ecdela]MBU9847150.1 terminase [Rahnella ecdela]